MRLRICWFAFVICFLTVTLPLECQEPSAKAGWRKLDAVAFSVLAPPGWRFQQLPGADSYVGEFIGEGLVLRFDFGSHSNPLRDAKKPAYVVVYKHIGGHHAKVVSPTTPRHGITGVYFQNTFDSNKLSMFAENLNSGQQ